MLLDFGAHMEEKDDRGLTPLLCAAKAGKTETTDVLCSCGADMNAIDEKGDTALAMLVDQDLIDAAYKLSTVHKASITRCSRNRKKAQRTKLLLTLRERQIKTGKISKDESSGEKASMDASTAMTSGSPVPAKSRKKNNKSKAAKRKAATVGSVCCSSTKHVGTTGRSRLWHRSEREAAAAGPLLGSSSSSSFCGSTNTTCSYGCTKTT